MSFGALLVDTIQASTEIPTVFQNKDGAELGRLCRAFVQFNLDEDNHLEITQSFNVSSISCQGIGKFIVKFALELDTNSYCSFAVSQETVNVKTGNTVAGKQTQKQCTIEVTAKDGLPANGGQINFVVFA